MRLIGQRITELHAERMPIKPGTIHGPVSTKAVPKSVRLGEGTVGTALPLIVGYEFASEYTLEKPKNKNAAEIQVKGEVIFAGSKEESESMLKSWKKNKQLPKEHMEIVLQSILSSSQVYAITLAKDINLPSPIPLPRVQLNGTK